MAYYADLTGQMRQVRSYTTTICYIYPVFIKTNIPPVLRNKAKRALLVATFLFSFFSLSAYVNTAQQPGQIVRSEQLISAALGFKHSISYSRLLAFPSQKPIAAIAKQNKSAIILFNRQAFVAYTQSRGSFILVKPAIAYPIGHIYFSAAIS